MVALCQSRAKLVATLVCLVLGFAALPARGHDVKYFPDGTVLVVSVDLAGFLKSKVRQEASKQIKEFEEGLKNANEHMGIPIENIARMSLALAATDAGNAQGIVLVATVKPITFADIKSAKKPSRVLKNFKYKEVKVGVHTIYQESFQFQFDSDDKPGPVIDGQALCVVQDKLVIQGEVEALKKVLERNKPAALLPRLETGIKQVGFADMLNVIVDFASVPPEGRREITRDLERMIPGAEKAISSVQAVTVRVNAGDQVKASATLTCKDAAGAADVKKIADAGVVALKAHLKDEKIPAEAKELAKSVHAFLDAFKTSSKETQVGAEVTVEAATAVSVVRAVFEATTKKQDFKKVEPSKVEKN